MPFINGLVVGFCAAMVVFMLLLDQRVQEGEIIIGRDMQEACKAYGTQS